MKTKRIALLTISLLTSTAFLSGCDKKEAVPTITKIDYGTIRKNKLNSIEDLVEIDYDNLLQKTINKESFILIIYGSKTCGCWTTFKPIITDYINDKDINVEYIQVSAIRNKEEHLGLYLADSVMPSIAIFNRGKLSCQAVYEGDMTKIFKDKQSFYNYMEEKIILPTMYFIEKTTLETYIAENKEMLLYIARSLCPDCGNVNRDVLQSWSDSYKGKEKLYIFDIQSYRDESSVVYQEIKDWIGLSPVNNDKFGFDIGAVPTFQYRIGEVVEDMIVTNNDSVNTENGTLESYFTEERVNNSPLFKNEKEIKTILDGMALDAEIISNWRNNSHDFYIKYHYPLLNKFLNNYIDIKE